jgi:thiamine monophosphate kinase
VSGDEYELCFTVAEANLDKVLAIGQAVDAPLKVVGALQAGVGVTVLDRGTRVDLDDGGFRHFG